MAEQFSYIVDVRLGCMVQQDLRLLNLFLLPFFKMSVVNDIINENKNARLLIANNLQNN